MPTTSKPYSTTPVAKCHYCGLVFRAKVESGNEEKDREKEGFRALAHMHECRLNPQSPYYIRPWGLWDVQERGRTPEVAHFEYHVTYLDHPGEIWRANNDQGNEDSQQSHFSIKIRFQSIGKCVGDADINKDFRFAPSCPPACITRMENLPSLHQAIIVQQSNWNIWSLFWS